VTASLFPVAFINNRIMNWFLRVLLFTEFTGIVNACWPLAWGLDLLLQLKEPDFEAEGNYDKSMGAHIMDRIKSIEQPIAQTVKPGQVAPATLGEAPVVPAITSQA